MAYKIVVNGMDVVCDTVTDMVTAVERLSKMQQKPADRASNTTNGAAPPSKTQVFGAAYQAIKDAASPGLASDKLMELIEVVSPKGIGSRMSRTYPIIKAAGIDIDDVVQNQRFPEGKFWVAGPKIDAALMAVKKAEQEGKL